MKTGQFSLFSRDIETEVIPACLDLGASLVAYSPLGRDMLTGRFKTDVPDEGDYRLITPRYQGDAFSADGALVDEIEAIASTKSCTPAQVALAWVIGRGEHVLTIPGTTKRENMNSNFGAYDVALSNHQKRRSWMHWLTASWALVTTRQVWQSSTADQFIPPFLFFSVEIHFKQQ